jgi:HAD superfamily hydrolase (TIGR01484 family)
LKNLFAPVWEDMAFICENGAVVFYKDQIIAQQVIPKDELLELIHMIDEDERTEVILSSPYTTNMCPKTETFPQQIRDLGNHVTVLDKWEDAEEPLVKVAWFEAEGVEHRLSYWQSKIKPPAKVVTSGAQWLDILFPTTHKGTGIEALQKHFGIAKEEIVAFGDNLNDTEMLSSVGYPIAMKTGKEAILKMCPYHTDCVETTVRQILDGEFPLDK